jgi:hypothetical protein
MKRILYATTALMTAAVVAGTSQQAMAQTAAPAQPAPATEAKKPERIKLALSGYFQQWLSVINQNIDTPSSPTGARNRIKTNTVDNKFNSEICVIGETTLDNGLSVGVNVQLEGNSEADVVDESYLYVSSPTYGRLIVGDENNAGYLLHVTMPDGGVSIDSGDSINARFFEQTTGVPSLDTPLATTNLRIGDNDSGKFTYLTPRFAGFQAGISYIPQLRNGGDDQNAQYFNETGGAVTRNRYKNGWAGGVNYTEKFGEFGVQASGGVMYFDRGQVRAPGGEAGSGSDLFVYNLGAQGSIGGFSLGGAFLRSPNKATNTSGSGIAAVTSAGGTAWNVGTAYEFGPYKVGLGYQYGDTLGAVNGASAGQNGPELQQAILSGTYTMGPGIRLVGGLFGYRAETQDGRVTGNDNNGGGFVTGLKLGF